MPLLAVDKVKKALIGKVFRVISQQLHSYDILVINTPTQLRLDSVIARISCISYNDLDYVYTVFGYFTVHAKVKILYGTKHWWEKHWQIQQFSINLPKQTFSVH